MTGITNLAIFIPIIQDLTPGHQLQILVGDNDKKDFYKYDPVSDEWSELVGFGGEKRRYATSFTIDDYVYMGTGVSNGLYKEDFWTKKMIII